MDKTKRKFKFTRDAVDALPVPAEGRVDYSDTENVGLQLRVSSSGRKMFRVNLYKDGKNNHRPRDFIRATVSQVMLYALCQEDLEHVIETYDEAWQLLDEAYGLLSSDCDDWLIEGDENVWH